MTPSVDEVDAGKRSSDRVLLVVIIMLMMIGLLAIYSAIAFFAETKHTTAGHLILIHMVKLGIAVVALLFFSKIDYHLVARFSKIALLLSWLFLIIVIAFGIQKFGAKRELVLGPFSFQPTSFAAASLLLYVASLLNQKQEYIKSFTRSFVPIMLWIIVTCGLIGIEDYSTSAILLMMCLILLFVGRMNIMHLMGLILVGALGSFILISHNPARMRRVTNYFDQVIHIKSNNFARVNGYQAQQSQIAIARGEVFGVGMGKSSERYFLPAPYNDFIFSIITEEYGLIGATFILVLFTIILFRGFLHIAKNSKDMLGTLIAVGCTISISFYAFVNAAVAAGLFPVTGLPMPFISYGGTSMLFTACLVGVLLNISKKLKVAA